VLKILVHILIVIFLLIGGLVSAQDSTAVNSSRDRSSSDLIIDRSLFDDSFKTDLLSNLPPLEEMIDTAVLRSPEMKFYYSRMKEYEYFMKDAKLHWTKGIYLAGESKVGSYQNTPLDELSIGYSYGVRVQVPIYDILSSGVKSKSREFTMRGYIEKYEQAKRDLTERIIGKYYDLTAAEELFKINIKSKQAMLVNLRIAEKQYTHGEITIADYARINQMFNDVSSQLLSSQTLFLKSYKELEVVIGKKFSEFYRK